MPNSYFIYDAHRDIAYDALYFGRDYRWSVAEARKKTENTPLSVNGPSVTGLPDALVARVGLVNATLYVEPRSYKPWASLDYVSLRHEQYTTAQEAHDLAREQLEYYQGLVAETPTLRLIKNKNDLLELKKIWIKDKEADLSVQGLVLMMEGADPIREPEEFEYWYLQGVRFVGTSWTRTRYAGGTNSPGPLTDLGKRLLKVMGRFQAVLDLSHMSEEACMQSLDLYQGSVIASHSNPRKFCDTDRHLSDEAIKLLAKRNGVMGITLLNFFWGTNWYIGKQIPLSRVIEAIDYVCQLTGSAQHIGIGTDFWAGDGSDNIPEELDSYPDLQKIAWNLEKAGYKKADIENIMSQNMLRILSTGLPEE